MFLRSSQCKKFAEMGDTEKTIIKFLGELVALSGIIHLSFAPSFVSPPSSPHIFCFSYIFATPPTYSRLLSSLIALTIICRNTRGGPSSFVNLTRR